MSVPVSPGADRTTDYIPVRIGLRCDVLLQTRSSDRNGKEEAVSRPLAAWPHSLALALLGLALGLLQAPLHGPIAYEFDGLFRRGAIGSWAGG